MAITSLEIHQLRNLKNLSLKPHPGFNLIIGKNGSGKTSILEAIHCLGRGKSFRTHKTNYLICEGTRFFTVVGRISQKGREFTIGMRRQRGQSDIRLAGKNITRASELTEVLPVAVLDPSLHRLIEEGSEGRRKFLDWGVFHVEPAFRGIWNTYRKILAQRNAALKAGWSQAQIQHWDYELVEAAECLDRSRQAYLADFANTVDLFTAIFTGINEISLDYYRGWREGADFSSYLKKQFCSDRERGFTQFGPHRADLRIRMGKKDARDVLSRGQQKVLVASLILAQCRQVDATELSTLILVDDLPAELDQEKRSGLIEALGTTGARVFITGTDKMLFNDVKHLTDSVFHVEQGRIADG